MSWTLRCGRGTNWTQRSFSAPAGPDIAKDETKEEEHNDMDSEVLAFSPHLDAIDLQDLKPRRRQCGSVQGQGLWNISVEGQGKAERTQSLVSGR